MPFESQRIFVITESLMKRDLSLIDNLRISANFGTSVLDKLDHKIPPFVGSIKRIELKESMCYEDVKECLNNPRLFDENDGVSVIFDMFLKRYGRKSGFGIRGSGRHNFFLLKGKLALLCELSDQMWFLDSVSENGSKLQKGAVIFSGF